MRFETVSPIEFVKRCRDLFDQNYAEAALPGHQFNLDESAYVQYEKQTPSFAIVAYDGEVLAGFCSVFVSFHQHTSEVMATNDAIFVRPEYRSGILAGQLFVKAEREAKARGAVAFQDPERRRTPRIGIDSVRREQENRRRGEGDGEKRVRRVETDVGNAD